MSTQSTEVIKEFLANTATEKFTYRLVSLSKAVTSPFSLHAKVSNGKIVYFQFMEDTFATARTFSQKGTWTIKVSPNRPEFEA